MNNQLNIQPIRNRSIDIFRFIAASSAVAAHCGFLIDINETFYDAVVNMVLGRFVVQFFCCVSGYFFCKSLLAGQAAFKKQFPRMLKIYIIWTIIYYCASFFQSVIINKEPIGQFLVERVFFFLTEGSYPHLWNFPAILYSMIIIALVYKLFKEKGLLTLSIISIGLFIIGALGSPYYMLFKDVSILFNLFNHEGFFVFRSILLIGLPFTSLGYIIIRLKSVFDSFSNRKLTGMLAIFGMIYTVEGILVVFFLEGVERPYSQLATYTFVMLLFVTLLRFPMPKLAKTSEMMRRLANFVYFIHPLLIVIVTLLLGMLNLNISPTILFFIIQGASMLMGYILVKINTPFTDTLLGLPVSKKSKKLTTN